MKREIHIWAGMYDAIGSRASVLVGGRRIYAARRYSCADGHVGWRIEEQAVLHDEAGGLVPRIDVAGPELRAELEAARDRFFVRLGLGEVDATGQARGMRWASGSPVEVGHG